MIIHMMKSKNTEKQEYRKMVTLKSFTTVNTSTDHEHDIFLFQPKQIIPQFNVTILGIPNEITTQRIL